jgi:AraC-like DNA-binding protein
VKLARNTEEFLAAPIGRYVVGRTFVGWCAARDLAGTTQWGEPSEDDVRAMLALMDVVRHPQIAPTGCLLMDCRAIERVAPDVLMRYIEQARDSAPQWAPRITRQAVIIPDGLRGLLLAAPMPLIAPTYPFRFAVDLESALEFLAHPEARAACAEIDAVVIAARGTPVLLRRLQAVLVHDLGDATVERCASALATSTRSLQRDLRTLETSFSRELRRARVAAAAELLKMSDIKIDAIARRLGFGTASRMSSVLRRDLGVSASELRARR